MTQYEIWDLRNSIWDRNLGIGKLLLTVTFTVFGAAYYLKNDLDVLAGSALMIFYTLSVASSIQGIRIVYVQSDHLNNELAMITGETGDSTVGTLRLSRASKISQYLLIIAAYLSFLPYMLVLHYLYSV